jgi:pyridoxal phosphate enzyme (YggS family)
VTAETVALAGRAGLRDLGENYVQELEAKRDRAPEATWHFIGRLQRNKAHRVLAASDVVQTLEPGPAAERLARLAEERDDPVRCLVEVDFTGGRVGVSPDELEAFLEHTATLAALRIGGLMTVAPFDQDPRPTFASLRELRDRLRKRFEGLDEVSMGMSADLEAAVEEGATMVRVGTAIFGPRSARRR